MTPPAETPVSLRAVTLAVATLAAAAYGLAEGDAPQGSPLAIAGAVLLLLAPILARGWRPGAVAGAAIAVAALALGVLDYLVVSRDAVLALGRTVLGLQLVRVLAPAGARERRQILLLALMHVVAASVLTVSLVFAVLLAPLAVCATWALALEHLAHASARAGLRPPPASFRFLAGTACAALVILVLTGGIFLVVPRIGAGLLEAGLARQPIRMSGFSDSVRIGEMGEILRAGEPVMWVEFPDGGEGPGLRFRGRVFETYAGCRWSAPTERRPDGSRERKPMDMGMIPVGDFQTVARIGPVFRTVLTPEDGALRVHQKIRLAPMASAALFVAGPVESLAFERRGITPDGLLVDPDGAVIEWPFGGRRVASEAIQYEVVSWLRPGTAEPAATPPPMRPDTATRTAAWPGDLTAEAATEIGRLARAHAAGRDPLADARTLQTWLRDSGEFRYSLDMPEIPPGADPVAHFLTTARSGHCEYYATSLVLLLRSLRHSARLVTGFVGGERNPMGGYRLVRQSDAHAWVEVLGDGGWETLDPTPRADEDGGFRLASQILDYIRYRWYSGVVEYSFGDQRRALREALQSLTRFRDSLRGLPGRVGGGLRDGRGVLALALGAAALLLAWPGWRRRGRGGTAVAAEPFYAETLQVLAARGVVRSPAQTPREVARVAVAAAAGPPAALETLTEAYCDVRYGGRALDGVGRAAVDAALGALRAAARPGAPGSGGP